MRTKPQSSNNPGIIIIGLLIKKIGIVKEQDRAECGIKSWRLLSVSLTKAPIKMSEIAYSTIDYHVTVILYYSPPNFMLDIQTAVSRDILTPQH